MRQKPTARPGKAPIVWTSMPLAVVSQFMTFLPLESFACDHTNVALVAHTWRHAARNCRAHLRVTADNVQWIGRLCRLPFVEHIDTDHLDETATDASRHVRHLRSLTWRSRIATSFAALPDIVRNNSQLISLTGSRRHFSQLCKNPVTRAIARTCERLLANRSEAARISDIGVSVCVCGDRYIVAGQCHVPDCPTFCRYESRARRLFSDHAERRLDIFA